MLFKNRKKYSIIFYLPTRNMHPTKLFNRARTKPCFFQSRLARIYARPANPPGCTPVTGILTQKKTQPGGRTPEADSSGTKKRVPALQLSDRPVAYGQEQKTPRNKFYQIV